MCQDSLYFTCIKKKTPPIIHPKITQREIKNGCSEVKSRVRRCYLAEVGCIDLCLCNLWPLGCYSVAVLVVHPFFFVQTLEDRARTCEVCVSLVKSRSTVSTSPHFIGDLAAEFGVDDIRRVGDRGVLEGGRLLAVHFLRKTKKNYKTLYVIIYCIGAYKDLCFRIGIPGRLTSLMRWVARLEPSICRAPVAIQAAPRR